MMMSRVLLRGVLANNVAVGTYVAIGADHNEQVTACGHRNICLSRWHGLHKVQHSRLLKRSLFVTTYSQYH